MRQRPASVPPISIVTLDGTSRAGSAGEDGFDLRGANTTVRGFAIEGLIGADPDALRPHLGSLLQDASAEVRYWTVFAVWELRAREHLPALEGMAREDHAHAGDRGTVSEEARRALAELR